MTRRNGARQERGIVRDALGVEVAGGRLRIGRATAWATTQEPWGRCGLCRCWCHELSEAVVGTHADRLAGEVDVSPARTTSSPRCSPVIAGGVGASARRSKRSRCRTSSPCAIPSHGMTPPVSGRGADDIAHRNWPRRKIRCAASRAKARRGRRLQQRPGDAKVAFPPSLPPAGERRSGELAARQGRPPSRPNGWHHSGL